MIFPVGLRWLTVSREWCDAAMKTVNMDTRKKQKHAASDKTNLRLLLYCNGLFNSGEIMYKIVHSVQKWMAENVSAQGKKKRPDILNYTDCVETLAGIMWRRKSAK